MITPACKTTRLIAQKRGQGGHSGTNGAWGAGPGSAGEDWELVRRINWEAMHWGGEREGRDVALVFGGNAGATPAGVESGAHHLSSPE